VHRISQAIDELAARAQATRPGEAAGYDTWVVTRLAELWAQLAELDPEMARRLPNYEA
jgi:hypothetical protein